MYPQTDIVIPVHGALPYLKDCVRTLREFTLSYRLIFVDDFSNDPEVTAFLTQVKEDIPGQETIIVKTTKQKWFTRASNIGLSFVRTDKVVLLNSDCVVGKDWLQEMYDVWQEVEQGFTAKRIALVASTLSDEPRRYRLANYPDYATGHCWLVDMNVMKHIANVRGTPGRYFNELDQAQIHIASDRCMCWDLERLGFLIVASHKAAVGHHGGKSWGYDLNRVSRLTLSEVDG